MKEILENLKAIMVIMGWQDKKETFDIGKEPKK